MSVNPTRPRFRHPALARAACGVVLFVIVVVTVLAAASPAGAAHEPSTPVRDRVEAPAANATGPATSANARFVVDAYDRLLGRSADTAGLDFHLGRLAAGGDRTRLAFTYGLLFSTEGSRQEVRRAYDDLLGRSPDAAGDAYWTEHLRGRGVLDLRVLLLASDEFRVAAGGTDDAWLQAVYLELLGRQPDAGGRAHWLGALNAGIPRVLVAAGLYLSDEALGHRVDTYYVEALGRTPSEAERRGAVAVVRAEGERGLRARLWSSDEVFERYLRAATA